GALGAVRRASRGARSTAPEHLVLGWYAALQGALQLYALTAVQVQRHEAWTPLALIVLPMALAWWLARRAARAPLDATASVSATATRGWPVSSHPLAWRRGLLLPLLA